MAGRDRVVRQHIREARLATVWVLEDWGFQWTVTIDRGKVRFDRRPARVPDITLRWPDAREFLARVEEGRAPDDSMQIEGSAGFRQYVEPVYRSFCRALEQVMKDPVDDAGNPLV